MLFFTFQGEYSHFSAAFMREIFLWIFLDYRNTKWTDDIASDYLSYDDFDGFEVIL